MNNRKKTINDLLGEWGEKQCRLPAKNDLIKSAVLAKFNPSTAELKRIKHRIPWLSLAFAGLAILVFVTSSISVPKTFAPQPAAQNESGSGFVAQPQALNSFGSGDSILKYWPKAESPISDNREFLKKDYNAAVRTREVNELTGRIETIVRGMSGRVDSSSRSEKSGYVSFAIPVGRLESFRAEIKSLVWEKFYTEQIYTQNLLPQKQSIEEQQKQAEKNLSQLKPDRDALIGAHNRTLISIQTQLQAIVDQLSVLQSATTTDPAAQARIAENIQELINESVRVKTLLATENRDYQTKLGNLDSQIKSAEDNVDNVKKQDQNLLDNVATIQGTISLSWISIWEILDLYLPGSLIGWVFTLAAIIAYIWNRRRSQLII